MIAKVVLAVVLIALALGVWEVWTRRRAAERLSARRERHLLEQSEWREKQGRGGGAN